MLARPLSCWHQREGVGGRSPRTRDPPPPASSPQGPPVAAHPSSPRPSLTWPRWAATSGGGAGSNGRCPLSFLSRDLTSASPRLQSGELSWDGLSWEAKAGMSHGPKRAGAPQNLAHSTPYEAPEMINAPLRCLQSSTVFKVTYVHYITASP